MTKCDILKNQFMSLENVFALFLPSTAFGKAEKGEATCTKVW
jgi:hypothetical protein